MQMRITFPNKNWLYTVIGETLGQSEPSGIFDENSENEITEASRVLLWING